jgi:cobalt/nickel transport system permease protein
MRPDIPAFLLEGPPPRSMDGRGVRVRASFLDKGVHHLATVIRTAYLQWETASGKGLLQGLDARVKVLSLGFFIIIVSLKRDIAPQAAIAGMVFTLAVLSRLDLLPFYRRILFFGFVFGFIVALPSSLNVIVKGDVVVPLIHLSRPYDFWIYHIPADIGLTRAGMFGVLRLTMRVVNSLSLSFLMLYTTPFTEVVRALKVFRVPDAFLMITSLTYKYIFIFARTVEEMHLAKKSRLVGAVGGAHARIWIAGRMALMFKKTQLKCEELYKAMLSRGFTGEVRLSGFGRARGRDYMAGAFMFAAGAALLFM